MSWELLNNIDWKNLLPAVIISSIFAFIFWFIKGLYEYYVSAKDLPYPIWGIWYSAEYDVKSNVEDDDRNYYLKVKVKRRLYKKVKIVAIETLEPDPNKVETKWIVKANIVKGDTLVGTWRSKVKNTNRHGIAMIKFLDYGRATGYWVGAGEYPVYGYWIMSRNYPDLKSVSTSILIETNFKSIDVSKSVIEYPAPTTKTK